MHIQLWPEEVIQLQKELSSGLHPKLYPILEAIPSDDFPQRIAAICTYCDIVVDGHYDVDDIVNLCRILNKKLVDKRERPDGVIQLM